MTDITMWIELLVRVLYVIAAVAVIPLIKSKLGESKLAKAQKWLDIAVNAAEEAARTGLIDKQAKYGYALEVLEKNGITFDAITIQALIDSTCYQLFNQFKAEADEYVGEDDEY